MQDTENTSEWIEEAIDKDSKSTKIHDLSLSQKKEEIMNLLIVGNTGSGKSALANVLSETNEFEESINMAKNNLQKKVFEFNEKKYCVIEIDNLAEAICFIPERISQVLFVVDGILTVEKLGVFNFESGIAEYTTIVRTKFVHFKNKDECEKDKKQLLEGNESIAKMVKLCGIIHVNNPPINDDDDDDYDDYDDKEAIRINKKSRARSRTILLDHLEKKVCQGKYYELKTWEMTNVTPTFRLKITDYDNPTNLDIKKKGGKEITMNLLIVGNTGSGKSALANVLSETNEFEESVGITKNLQKKVFEFNEKKYCVIETNNIAEVINFMPVRINQVLFVVDGILTEEKIGMFNFESGIAEYTTIVRTKFVHFKNKDKREKDKKQLLEGNKLIAKIVELCDIVYVNNPPINIIGGDDDDDNKETGINKKMRARSRTVLLDHLEGKACPEKYCMWDKTREGEIRILLIVGNTGSGKSALANVLSGTDEFEESICVTRNLQKKVFEFNEKKYCVIETDNIAEVTYFMPEGISQVLFVVDGILTEEIGTFIFESGIAEYTTIVRTKFIHFKNKDKREKDKKQLLEGNELIAKIVELCGIIYVNNPPINIIGGDEDDDMTIRINKKMRAKSRTILLDNLEKNWDKTNMTNNEEQTASNSNTNMTSTEEQTDDNSNINMSKECQDREKDHYFSKVFPNTNSKSITPPKNHNLKLENFKGKKDSIFSVTSSRAIYFIKLPFLSPISNTVEIKTINRQMIQQLKLNYGLFLDGYDIQQSEQAIFSEDCEFNISLYKGQPIVYTNINDPDLLNKDNYNNALQPSDACINFPIAEITYNKGDLLRSFLKNVDNDDKLYGHLFAGKVTVGGKLFIKKFNSNTQTTQTQADILKFYLYYIYHSAKYSTEISFINLLSLNLLTLDGEKLNTHEKLANWMNNLYQKKMGNIISYDNLIPISQLKHSTYNLKAYNNEKQPGVANFKKKLSLDEWVGYAVNDSLISWVEDFHLFRGIIINENDEIEISKKIAIDFIEIPKVNSSDKSYLEIIEPATNLEVNLISNNVFSIETLSEFPFLKSNVKSNVKNYKGYIYLLAKCEQYEILLNDIEPTKEFEKAIEGVFDSMKPLKALQNIFNEYGHIFPRRIILGRSLKNILPNTASDILINRIDLKPPVIESFKSHLDKLNISYLLTRESKIIEKKDLSNWNANNNFEVIEYDDIIPLCEILNKKQKRRVDIILNKQNNYKIIMTGITDLKSLNNDNVGHYKRINLELSLEDENYEVFGSIISENNSKLEGTYVNFGLYDFNGFYAIIKKFEETKPNIDITKCYILWMIVGDPSKLSVFSPKNRDFEVEYFKKSITLQPNQSNYHIYIDAPFPLSQKNFISVHAYYSSTNYEPVNVFKLAEWKDEYINVQVIKPTNIETAINIELRICILSTDYISLNIDNNNNYEISRCPLDLIGYALTREHLHGMCDSL